MSQENKYCPYCGAPQEKGTKFCGSCGASMSDDIARATETAYKPSTPPPAYGTTPTYQPPPQQPKNNATIALILGLVPLVFSCFIFPIIGLTFVKKAEQLNEDPQLTKIAKIVNWIFLGLSIFGTIGIIVYVVVITFSFGWY